MTNVDIKVDISSLYDIIKDMDNKDKIIMFIIYDILVNVCKKDKNNGSYYFDSSDETEENEKYMMRWIDTIHKIAPFGNITHTKKTKKKIYVVLKHLFNSLNDKKLELESETHIIKKSDSKKTTLSKHYINGL